ncbi:MAG TPA: hypothetical protein VGN16_06185 [Acidobacteriaceae bacterium]|jgi:hypothetical protein
MMADEQAKPAADEEKKHGDPLEDSHAHNAIPAAEDGGHDRSVAAHLHEHSHLHDNMNAVQHHVPSQQLREPPQEVTRTGKGHRGE